MWIDKPPSKLDKIKSTNAQRTMKPKFRWNIRKYLISLNMFILIHMQSLNFLCNRLHWSTLVMHDDFVLYLLESIPCRTRYDTSVHILHYNITRDVLFIFVRAPTISPKSAKKSTCFVRIYCVPQLNHLGITTSHQKEILFHHLRTNITEFLCDFSSLERMYIKSRL